MRIIKTLITSFVLIGLIAGLGFLIIREVLLYRAADGLRDVLQHQLIGVNIQPAQHDLDCQKYKTDFSAPLAKSLEVVFTNDHDYQFQVVCDQGAFQPIVIKTYQLPPMVTKMPGSAGFVWSKNTPTTVTLEIWGRKSSVTLNNGDIVISQGQASLTSTLFPEATCKGYGFQCCSEQTSQGAGEQAVAASDCSQSCFTQCIARPVILSLNTQPFYNPQNRTLQIQSGQTVSFHFVTNVPVEQVKQIVLSFGDGQSFQDVTGSDASHTYTCFAASCQYQAELLVTNQAGLTNVPTSISKVGITVTR